MGAFRGRLGKRKERKEGGRDRGREVKEKREEGQVIISLNTTAMEESLSLGEGVVVAVGGVCGCDGIKPRMEESAHL